MAGNVSSRTEKAKNKELIVEATTRTSSSGIGVLSTIGIVFIVLKLCGVIGWNWFWVLTPFWGQLALALVIIIFLAIIVGIAKLLS